MRDYLRVLKMGALEKRLTVVVFFLAILGTGLDATVPLVLKLIFDFLEKQFKNGFDLSNINDLYKYFLLYLLITVAKDAITLINDFYSSMWWLKTRNHISSKVFGHLERLSITFFEKEATGKVTERITQGSSDIQSILDASLTDILPQIIYILVAMFFLFNISAAFGLIIFVGIPAFIILSLLFTKTLNFYQDRVRDAREKAMTVNVETIGNIKTVKSFATEDRHAKQFNKTLADLLNANMDRNKKRIKMNIFRFSVSDSSQILILLLGAYWAATGKITMGTLVMAWTYVGRAYGPLWYLTRVYDSIQRDMRSVRRLFDTLDAKEDIKDLDNATQLKEVKGGVELRNVKFKYNNRNVINGLSLKIPAGSVVAIVGKSGVGKSTLVKLLMRFYDPQAGQILIDGKDIKKVTQKSLRQNIGVVLQDTAIFNDTAYNNIAYAKNKAKMSEVLKAAKIAHAHEFVSKLESGYETIVGERGVKLSGGEQQRINIARAVLKNPPILVLDEATSHLDSESEKLIQDALWKLIEGRTSIIIAHRLSTVMKADLIVVLDKGKISEMGTHDELVKKEGIYNKLFKIQSGSYTK
ncbi:MAG: ABC transporter ATP-binding protein [bacterium]|nr:ABC transporter ATP-binding protein [bacterium]